MYIIINYSIVVLDLGDILKNAVSNTDILFCRVMEESPNTGLELHNNILRTSGVNNPIT